MRAALLAGSRSPMLRRAVETRSLPQRVVQRFVPGVSVDAALTAGEELLGSGRCVTLDYLGEDTTDRTAVASTVAAYLLLLDGLAQLGLTEGGRAEVSVKLSAVGQLVDGGLARDSAATICAAAAAVGTTVTFDMEDHTTTDSTLDILRDVRQEFPETGAVLQAYLRRTEGDCRDLAHPGSRVRLCKGAYKEPAGVAFQRKTEIRDNYVHCLQLLLAGGAYPMIATHDPRLIETCTELTTDRHTEGFEYQMLFGVRPTEQLRLVAAGVAVRVYVPYGDDYYGYFMRRLAERPANVTFFLRAITGRT